MNGQGRYLASEIVNKLNILSDIFVIFCILLGGVNSLRYEGHLLSEDAFGWGDKSSLKLDLPIGQCDVEHQQKVLDVQMSYKCEPRQKVVQLELPVLEGIMQVIPSHVSVHQCGGSCSDNPSHSCIPLQSRKKHIDVMIVKSTYSQGPLTTLCSSQSIREDISCTCGCHLSQSDCTSPHHTFHHTTCSCSCDNLKDKHDCLLQGKIWDQSSCSCSCSPHTWILCSTGYLFDNQHTCSCVSTHLQGGIPMVAVVGVVIVSLFGVVSSLLYIRHLDKRNSRRESLGRVLEESQSS